MNISHRRVFICRAIAGVAALTAVVAHAQASTPMLPESDPQAMALGYAHDTTKVDSKKFPNHAVTQTCGNCQLFQGSSQDATGACPLFAGKQVATAGWCSAWNKKAG